jgi:hypothetical protein
VCLVHVRKGTKLHSPSCTNLEILGSALCGFKASNFVVSLHIYGRVFCVCSCAIPKRHISWLLDPVGTNTNLHFIPAEFPIRSKSRLVLRALDVVILLDSVTQANPDSLETYSRLGSSPFPRPRTVCSRGDLRTRGAISKMVLFSPQVYLHHPYPHYLILLMNQ